MQRRHLAVPRPHRDGTAVNQQYQRASLRPGKLISRHPIGKLDSCHTRPRSGCLSWQCMPIPRFIGIFLMPSRWRHRLRRALDCRHAEPRPNPPHLPAVAIIIAIPGPDMLPRSRARAHPGRTAGCAHACGAGRWHHGPFAAGRVRRQCVANRQPDRVLGDEAGRWCLP